MSLRTSHRACWCRPAARDGPATRTHRPRAPPTRPLHCCATVAPPVGHDDVTRIAKWALDLVECDEGELRGGRQGAEHALELGLVMVDWRGSRASTPPSQTATRRTWTRRCPRQSTRRRPFRPPTQTAARWSWRAPAPPAPRQRLSLLFIIDRIVRQDGDRARQCAWRVRRSGRRPRPGPACAASPKRPPDTPVPCNIIAVRCRVALEPRVRRQPVWCVRHNNGGK